MATLTRKNQRLALALTKNSEAAVRLSEAGVLEAIGTDSVFEDIDRAIGWAEDELARANTDLDEAREIPFEDVDVLGGLTPSEITFIKGYTRLGSFHRGEAICSEGDTGKELFIVTRGHASAYINQVNGRDIRLATFAPGSVFGELAILDAGPRSASVIADDDVTCYVLSEAQFAALVKEAPSLTIKLLSGLGRELSKRLRGANKTIQQLES